MQDGADLQLGVEQREATRHREHRLRDARVGHDEGICRAHEPAAGDEPAGPDSRGRVPHSAGRQPNSLSRGLHVKPG